MTGETPRVSVVVPAYNEGEHITPVLDRIFESVRLQCEVLVVVDSADDDTVPVVTRYADKEPRLRCIVNSYGLFRVMTKERAEIIIEGSDDAIEWSPEGPLGTFRTETPCRT